VIEAIANAINSVQSCSLLDIDPGESTNRTVYTFVGSPEAVVQGALAGAVAASKLIDMSIHTGIDIYCLLLCISSVYYAIPAN